MISNVHRVSSERQRFVWMFGLAEAADAKLTERQQLGQESEQLFFVPVGLPLAHVVTSWRAYWKTESVG